MSLSDDTLSLRPDGHCISAEWMCSPHTAMSSKDKKSSKEVYLMKVFAILWGIGF